MTLEEFLCQEAAAARRFIDKHVMEDFLHGHAGYSREYRCDCGFRCSDSRRIYEHVAACPRGRVVAA